MENIEKNKKQPKIYFIYFIIFTIIVLIIFAVMIISNFWDYHSRLSKMDDFYKQRLEKIIKASPAINTFDPIKGGSGAKITIFEFSDFICPACKNLQTDLKNLEKYFGNRIRFVYKGVPITIHPETRQAIEAAYCAREQNKFWEYKDLLFENSPLLNTDVYRQYAGQLQMSVSDFNQCLDSNKYLTVIDQNLIQALSLEVTSVPTIYINNQKIEGFISFTKLKKIIEEHLLYQ